LALAIRRIIWAELALSPVIAVPAFAQSQPATTETPAGASATSGAAAAAATPVAASGTAAASSDKNVKQLKTFQVMGSVDSPGGQDGVPAGLGHLRQADPGLR
jgi:iron complex outermembrane receptor protein